MAKRKSKQAAPAKFRNRIVSYGTKRADQFQAHPQNWRQHPPEQRAALGAALNSVGWVGVVLENQRTGHLLDGHERIWQALDQGDATEVPYITIDVSEDEEHLILATYDPIGAMAQTDHAMLDALLSELRESALVQDDPAVGELLDAAREQAEAAESAPDGDALLSMHDVPDALWPTDNEWGVPVLDDHWQADAVDLPVNAYGAEGRKSKMQGTYHFYTDDYRFEGLWSDPTPIVNSGCVNVVEPNYSTNIQMPRAIVLWHVYRKRWLARYWQSRGIRVFVDLDVNPIFDDVNLIGVPAGWRAYACYMRKSDHKPDELLHFLEVATTRAGRDDVLLLVVGGEKDVQALCLEHKQCVWVPSFEQKFYRNYRQKTQGA